MSENLAGLTLDHLITPAPFLGSAFLLLTPGLNLREDRLTRYHFEPS